MFTSVPSFGLSDRNPTFLVRKQNVNLRRKKNGKHEWISFHSLKKVDTNALIADLNKILGVYLMSTVLTQMKCGAPATTTLYSLLYSLYTFK